jgi:hypothetical protein
MTMAATMISGDISFSGSNTVTDNLDGTTSIDITTTVSNASDRSGDFSLLTGNIQGDFFPNLITYDNATMIVQTPINPLWQISDTSQAPILKSSFELLKASVQEIIFSSGKFLLISGSGKVSLDGFDDTLAMFSYSTQDDYITYSSQTSAVPLPAAGWLFGSALIGLAGFARRRNAA